MKAVLCDETTEFIATPKFAEDFTKWLNKEVEDSVFEKENALKLIDTLEATNDTLRRTLVVSDAIRSIGKET